VAERYQTEQPQPRVDVMTSVQMRRALVLALVSARAFAAPGDWTPTRDAFDPVVIARYEAILAKDPFDDTALAKLDQLYRGRHTLAELERDLGDTASALVIRARLHLRHKDPAAALPLLERAAKLSPPFAARCWLAVAELRRGAGDIDGARAAYTATLAALPTPELTRRALRQLADLAVIAKSPDADTYFIQLLALSPNDAEVWTARGDALLAVNHAGLAIESYAQALQLAPDVPHRIEALERHGDALAKAHDPDGANADYRRAIALSPPGYFVVPELIGRLVDIAHAQQALPALAEQLEHEWPERTRDALKWSTLGSIYVELVDRPRAMVALRHATALAPWDLASQRLLVGVYDGLGLRDASVKQLEVAIRAAPSEATLQLELAQHMWPNVRALGVLDRTAKQFSRDVNVLEVTAKQFLAWERPARAERWLEQVVKLEPDDDDHWIALVQAYFAADDHAGAITAWKRVAYEMPGAKLRFAALLLEAQDPRAALGVIDESIALDGLDPEAYRLRSLAHEDLYNQTAAIEDALREVSLAPSLDRAAMHRGYHHVATLVAEILTPRYAGDMDEDDSEEWKSYLTRWHDAFWAEPANLDAGYLYLETLEINGWHNDSLLAFDEVRETAMRLEKLAPDDPDVLRLEARMFQARGLNRLAATVLRRLAILVPRAAPSIEKQLDQMEGVYGRLGEAYDPHIGVEEVPAQPIRFNEHRWMAGVAIDLGGALRGDMGSSIGVGVFAARAFSDPYQQSAHTTLGLRFDYNQRSGPMTSPDTLGVATGLWRNIALPDATFRFGFDERVEVRTGDLAGRAWDRFGLATDLGIALGLRAAPVDVGVRLEQWLAGGVRDTRALFELRLRLF
jgi:tetratricopeptide (TPR) repeat protein